VSLANMSALELARAITAEAEKLHRAARRFYHVPPPVKCGCCGDEYPEDELVRDRLNGKICLSCAEDFADLHVPEFDPLDKD